MPPVASVDLTVSSEKNFQSDEIARDLKLMDELEALARSMPPRTEGRRPTTAEFRTLAYEDQESAGR